MKILLVDNQFERVRSMRTILANLGYKGSDVANIENGEEAFKSLKRSRFDVVIVAWDAIGKGGLAFVKEANESASLRRIPVIIIATHPSRDDIKSAGEAKAAGFLVFPCSLEDVERTIEKAMDKVKRKESK